MSDGSTILADVAEAITVAGPFGMNASTSLIFGFQKSSSRPKDKLI
jgi:hypothetical protein